MANLNRYKFTFGNKTLTLTTEHDNLFMEEVERVAKEKYKAIKEQMPAADDEVLAILLAVNSLSTQLSREIEFDDKEKELEDFRHKMLSVFYYYFTNIGLELLYRLLAWYCSAGLLCCCNHSFYAGGWSFL